MYTITAVIICGQRIKVCIFPEWSYFHVLLASRGSLESMKINHHKYNWLPACNYWEYQDRPGNSGLFSSQITIYKMQLPWSKISFHFLSLVCLVVDIFEQSKYTSCKPQLKLLKGERRPDDTSVKIILRGKLLQL